MSETVVGITLGLLMVGGILCAIYGPLAILAALLAPYGWFAGERQSDGNHRGTVKGRLLELARQVGIAVVVFEVWSRVRGR